MGQLRKAERFGPGGVRADTLLTDFAYHLPPRGVVTPRALSASAIWCRDRAPVACISRIIGTTLAAIGWRKLEELLDAITLCGFSMVGQPLYRDRFIYLDAIKS
jgi:hypothetical protein